MTIFLFNHKLYKSVTTIKLLPVMAGMIQMGRKRNIDKIEHEILNNVYSDEDLADMYEDIPDDDWCKMSEKTIQKASIAYHKIRKC